MWWLTVVGILLILVALVDMLWTVLASSLGAGPFSRFSADTVWRTVTAGSPSARRRAVAGYAVVITLPFAWFVLFVAGFAAVLGAAGDFKVDLEGAPGPFEAILFAYGVVVALGTGYTSAGELVHYSGALIGIIWSSLSLTYVMQIVSADTRERAMASSIMAMGESPYTILDEALRQPGLGSFPLQVVSLSSTMSVVGQDHLAYPILKYILAAKEENSSVIAVCRFDETMTLLQGAVRDTDPLLLRAGQSAVSDYIDTLALRESSQEPPGLEVSALRSAGDRRADQADLDALLDRLRSRRRQLTSLLQRGGANWADVYSDPS